MLPRHDTRQPLMTTTLQSNSRQTWHSSLFLCFFFRGGGGGGGGGGGFARCARPATSATRCSASGVPRASSARRRAYVRTTSSSSRDGWHHSPSSCRIASCRAPAPGGGLGAGFAALGGTLVPGAELVLELIAFRRARCQRVARRHGRRNGRRDDARGEGAGNGAASMSRPRRALRAVRRPGARRDRRARALGRTRGGRGRPRAPRGGASRRSRVTALRSCRGLPRASPSRSGKSSSPRSQSFVSSSTSASPRSSRSTICSSSRCASSKLGAGSVTSRPPRSSRRRPAQTQHRPGSDVVVAARTTSSPCRTIAYPRSRVASGESAPRRACAVASRAALRSSASNGALRRRSWAVVTRTGRDVRRHGVPPGAAPHAAARAPPGAP